MLVSSKSATFILGCFDFVLVSMMVSLKPKVLKWFATIFSILVFESELKVIDVFNLLENSILLNQDMSCLRLMIL